MMKDDGGSAFAHIENGFEVDDKGYGNKFTVHHKGMTLRDWFAGQALAGLSVEYYAVYGQSAENVAEKAYQIADEMLSLRNK